jgi:hypothetical protein
MFERSKRGSSNLSVANVLDINRADSPTPVAGARVFNDTEEVEATPFLSELLARAEGERRTLEDVLAAEFGPLIPGSPETSACLKPDEVVGYFSGSIDSARRAHAEGCGWCKTLLAAAKPVREEFARIAKKARKSASAGSVQTTASRS